MCALYVTKYWPYEQGNASKRFLQLPVSLVDDLRRALHTAVGKNDDNKVTFKVIDYYGRNVYITFWDGIAYFGHENQAINEPTWEGQAEVKS